jgi:hypothetical protein
VGLEKKEPQGGQWLCDADGLQFAIGEQMGLVLSDVLQA